MNGGNTANGGKNTCPLVRKIPNTTQFPGNKLNASRSSTVAPLTQNKSSSTPTTKGGNNILSTFTATGLISSLIFKPMVSNQTQGGGGGPQAIAGSSNTSNTSSNQTLPPIRNQPTPLAKGLEREQMGNVIPGNQSTKFEGKAANETGPQSAAPQNVYKTPGFQAPGQQQQQTAAQGQQQTGQQQPCILGGNWQLNVTNGNITNLMIGFIMVHANASGRHMHNFTDFKLAGGNNSGIQLKPNGTTTIMGTVNILVNGTQKWAAVPTTMSIEKGSTITITVDSTKTNNHFGGQPIYGIVEKLKDQSGKDVLNLTK